MGRRAPKGRAVAKAKAVSPISTSWRMRWRISRPRPDLGAKAKVAQEKAKAKAMHSKAKFSLLRVDQSPFRTDPEQAFNLTANAGDELNGENDGGGIGG